MSSIRRRVLAVGSLLVVGGAVVAFAQAREPMSPLTLEALEAARTKWRQTGITDYDLTYAMAGGIYVVRVRAGRVVTLTRDEEPTTSHRLADFTVDGLFNTLERELDLLDNPNSPFGGDRSTILLRVRFDSERGYVRRYLRAVGGSGRSEKIEVQHFAPLPSTDDVAAR